MRLKAAEKDLRDSVSGAAKGIDFWGKPRSAEAHDRWHAKYEEVLELALSHDRFVPLEMPDARSPPSGELLLAWALQREGGKLAVFPECATVENDVTILGHSSTTCVVYRGPLTLEGTVRLCGTIVVLGDLVVNGTLIDGWASDSALVVIGNETVRAMEAGSDHIVTGDLRAEVLHIVSESTSVACGGTLEARALIAEHWDDGVKPDDLGPLLDRLSPRPSDELDASDLTRAFGRGDFALI